MNDTNLDFDSNEQLHNMLEQIGLALHAKNRIWGGESSYYWQLAETIRKAGRLATLPLAETQLLENFENDYGAGEDRSHQREERFLNLLKAQRTES